jgi:hypothetical protein
MEPNFNNSGEAEEIRKEMLQTQQRYKEEHASKMDELLNNVADNMDDQEEDIRDDGRRHTDMKENLTSLQQQLTELLKTNGL